MGDDAKKPVGRRTFLKRGLVGGAILALGGAGLYVLPTKVSAAPTRALAVLEPRAFQVLVAIARRVVTLEGADAVAIAHGVDDLLSWAPVEAQADTNKLLMLFENALPGLLLDARALPFTLLSPASQDGVLDSWRTSRIALRRSGYRVLRNACLVAHWGMESSFRAVSYFPPTGLNAAAYDDSKVGTPEWIAANAEKGKGT